MSGRTISRRGGRTATASDGPDGPDGQRIVVALPGGQAAELLLRRAAELWHQRVRAEVVYLHILSTAGSLGAARSDVVELRRQVEAVGGSLHVVLGDDVAEAVLQFARDTRATALMLGLDRGVARWGSRSGVVRSVLRAADGLEVQLVPVPQSRVPRRPAARRFGLTRRRRMLGWLAALVLPSVVTVVGLAAGELLARISVVVLCMLSIVVVAAIGGLGPALLSVLVAGMLLNYFFIPPTFAFTVKDPRHVLALLLMLVVAAVVALVVHEAARRREQAVDARTEAALLTEFATTVLTAAAPLQLLLEKVREAFSARSVALLQRDGTSWKRLASAAPASADDSGHARPDGASVDGAGPVRVDSDAPEVDTIEVDIAVDHDDVHLVLRGRPLTAGERRVLRGVASQALLAVRAQQSAAEAADAQRRAEMTELRSALLSAVGHDLRTPLSAIKSAAGSLRDPQLRLSRGDTATLVDTVAVCADRLQALVDSLLDSARLASGGVHPQLRPVGYDDVLARALTTLDHRHLITVQIDDVIPPVLADPGLLERVLANLAVNALTHGHARGVLARAAVVGNRVELRLSDRGPGVPDDKLEALFTPFQRRGDRDNTTGIGLGLAVARGFTEAMGGTLHAEPTPGGGLTMIVALPVDPSSTTVPNPDTALLPGMADMARPGVPTLPGGPTR